MNTGHTAGPHQAIADDDSLAAAVPAWVDTTRASIARVYDAMLNGKDNYAIDRQVKAQLLKVAPELERIARDNREWLIRVTRFLVGAAGIGQILDCGSGLPTAENTHQVAARINPDVTVVYVDNDPVVAAHGRALLDTGRNAYFATADLARPTELLAHDTVVTRLDLTEPTALMQVSTLHHLPDQANPAEIMRAYIDALPSGSYVAITHVVDPERWRTTVHAGAATPGNHGLRTDGIRLFPHPRRNRGPVRRT